MWCGVNGEQRPAELMSLYLKMEETKWFSHQGNTRYSNYLERLSTDDPGEKHERTNQVLMS